MTRQAPPVEIARQLDAAGFNVIPARYQGKAPQLKWEQFQERRTGPLLDQWFAGSKPRNYWVVCGAVSGIVVLDIDNDAAETYWRERLGDLLDQTTCVKTRNGHHYYFRLEGNDRVGSWSHHNEQTGLSFDVRADGTGVIVPPSVHESGHVYEWIRGPEHMLPVPKAVRGPEKGTATSAAATTTRSMLSRLLTNPPQEGGRNDWLARVAGHYAKEYRDRRDAYEVHCQMANSMLDAPLAEREYRKTVDSIWDSEAAKGEIRPEASNGWLVAGDYVLLCETATGEKKDLKYVMQAWSNFDIRAVGVVEDEDSERVYDVRVLRERQRDETADLLSSSTLSDLRKLRAWLARHGVNIMPPAGETCHVDRVDRLQAYLESQEPPQFRVVDALGWHRDGFLCHEGVIREDGLHGFDRHKPAPRLRNWAPYRYGFAEDEQQAAAVLREVLTFHDETVTSVFGSWWAACFLKPQVHQVASQFPFVALEAPSESGKTTGFFSLMLQLNGNTQGQVDPTRASLRDSVSAHQSGIVWVDDLSETAHLMDLLRQATGEGSVAKKGEDRTAQSVVRLVAPVCISGEALNLSGQKALLDRAIQIDVPSPTARRSLADPDRLQWLDILDLRRRWPDLTEVAGTLVAMALRRQELVAEVPALAADAGGRFGDKIGVVRMGARLLAAMTGESAHVERVDAWCLQQDSVGSENTLTLRLVPTALAHTGWLTKPQAADGRWPATPVFQDLSDVVWFSPQYLARWWHEMQHGRIEKRTESEEALTQQAHALGLGGEPTKRRFNLGGDRNKKVVYWALDRQLSRLVAARSRGTVPRVSPGSGGVQQVLGVHPEKHRLGLPVWQGQKPDGGL